MLFMQLIRGLLQYNIGEQLEPTVARPPSPAQGRRPSMELSTVIARQAQASAASVRVELAIELDLVNVTVEILKEDEQKLSRVDFLRSKFTFNNSSDGTRDIDLASQEILVSDIRFPPSSSIPQESSSNKINVFSNILQHSTTMDATKVIFHNFIQQISSTLILIIFSFKIHYLFRMPVKVNVQEPLHLHSSHLQS